MPWLVGVASTSLGGLRAGLLIALVGTVSLILVSVFQAPALRDGQGRAERMPRELDA
jgi:hypothetical protein